MAISANSFWNIANFRTGLIDALASEGIGCVVLAPGINRQWARNRGVQAIEIAIDRSGLNPLRDAKLLARYTGLLRRLRPDCFLSFTAKPNIYGALAARLTGIPSLPNVSGLGTAFLGGGFLPKLMTWMYRVAFANSPAVFFQNPDDRDLFVAKKIVRPEQAQLVPGSGIDLKRFVATPMRQQGPPRFLFIGRLLGDKGIREFVEAAEILKADRSEWRFQLLGGIDEGNRTGIARRELEAWIKGGAIEYLGEAGDVRPYIEEATAVVLPSYREGLPRVLLEGAAMGRPLIATDVPGCREVVVEGWNGFMCEARNADALSDAMRKLGELDPLRRTEMGVAGRNRISERYDDRLVFRAYLDAIGQLRDERRV